MAQRVSAGLIVKENVPIANLSVMKIKNNHISTKKKCVWKEIKSGGLRCVKIETTLFWN